MSHPTPLRTSRIAQHLGACRFAADLRVMGIVDSTQDVVRELAWKGAPDGLVVVAQGQRTGRGRRGSIWVSPSGAGLWFSLLIRHLPAEGCRAQLPSALGLAVARAIDATLALDARVKWPNDVLVAGHKVAGCLVEISDRPDGPPLAIAGIGINVDLDPAGVDAAPGLPAGALGRLAGGRVDREVLLSAVLIEIERGLAALESSGPDALSAEWRARDALPGATVTATEGERTLSGTVITTDPVQGILLRLDDGSEVRLRSAHAHISRIRLP